MPTDAEVAWLAGLFEGEGCFSIARCSAAITICMTDQDVLERANRIFPVYSGVRRRRKNPIGAKPAYIWSTGNRKRVEEFIALVLPWLGERRAARAREVLAFLETRPGYGAKNGRKTHCPKGHPYDIIAKTGRRCRRCRNEASRLRKRKYDAAKRAQHLAAQLSLD